MVKTKRTSSHSHGFTLVEILITIVILGIAITSISMLYWAMQRVQNSSRNLDLATRAAQTEIEVLRNNSYNSLNPVSPNNTIDFTSSLPAQLPGAKSGTVVVSQPSDGLRRVDVSVTYNDNGSPKTVELSSTIGVIGIGK